MTKKTKPLFSFTGPFLLGIFILLSFMNTCQRFEADLLLEFTTDSIAFLPGREYKLIGTIESFGYDKITQHGFCWSESQNPTTNDQSTQLGPREKKGTFESILTDLPHSTTFNVRSYMITDAGTQYSEEKSFTTPIPNLPVLTTTIITNISQDSAYSGGSISDDGGASITARGVCWDITISPTIDDGHTSDETGTGSFTSEISGLIPNTTYYIRAYASNGQVTGYGDEKSFNTLSISRETLTDYDGNVYQTVQIGDQIWMKENLKAIHYADGTEILLIENNSIWGTLTETDKAYCWNENSMSNRDVYGGLYTWAAAMNGSSSSDLDPSCVQGVCPDGWHLPSDEEWKQFEMHLGMDRIEADANEFRGTDEGGKLKSTGTDLWLAPNSGATNESEFGAIPGGLRHHTGAFINIREGAYFHSSTQDAFTNAWNRRMVYDLTSVYRGNYRKGSGFSVRCIEGQGYSIPTVTTSSASNITDSSADIGGSVSDDGGTAVTAFGVCWSTSSNPTISDDKSSVGSGIESFSSSLTGLSPSTTYYIRGYATNSVGTGYGETDSIITWQGSVTDYDGNVYPTVIIGNQIWMAENLKVTRYADGSTILLKENTTDWNALTATDIAYCWYDNSISNKDIYGGLYTWAAALNGVASSDANPSGEQGVCPDGWHLPSDEEWKQLEMYLGMGRIEADANEFRGTDEGGKLKSTGTDLWLAPNSGATNESEFGAIPGGFRHHTGAFIKIREGAYFHSSTQDASTNAWNRRMANDLSSIYRGNYQKGSGFSVRCVNVQL